MLDLLAVEPWRSVVPLANRNDSASDVLPAPAGPTSAMTLVPLVSPGMRLSLPPCWRGRRVACRAASALQTASVGLFHEEGKRGRVSAPAFAGEGDHAQHGGGVLRA